MDSTVKGLNAILNFDLNPLIAKVEGEEVGKEEVLESLCDIQILLSNFSAQVTSMKAPEGSERRFANCLFIYIHILIYLLIYIRVCV